MKKNSSTYGFSLVEITVVILVVGLLVTGTLYGLRLVQNTKIKSFIIQTTIYQNAATNFQKQYGTWPGDLANARDVLRDCSAVRQCNNGNGDQVVASSNNSWDCRLPNYTTGQLNFPCTPAPGTNINNGNETTQFWRHLSLAGLITDLRIRNDRYAWGDSMPKTRIVGGVQVIYEGNVNNHYVNGLTGHFFLIARDPRVLHANMDAVGNGALSIEFARILDTQMDDGLPSSGKFRSVGGWGCGNPGNANEYEGTALRQCTSFYKFDP
jgi:type II secretory pathway pseudopilin PulG